MALGAGVGVAVLDGGLCPGVVLGAGVFVAGGAGAAAGRYIVQGLDLRPGAEVAMAVGTTVVGANITVGWCLWSVDGREVCDMTGGAGVRVAESCILRAMTKGQTAWFQGVVADGRGIVAIITVGNMGLGHRIGIGRGVAGRVDAGWCGCHVAGCSVVHVHDRRGLVGMAHEAGSLGAGGDDHRNRGPGRVNRIDIAACCVAGVTGGESWGGGPQVGLQDIRPVTGMMAVRARLAVGLAEIGRRIDICCMLVGAGGKAVSVGREVTEVTVYALAAAVGGGADTGSGRRRMTGRATKLRMDLPATGKRRGCGDVTAYTVGSFRGLGKISLNRCRMVVTMGIEVGGMTLGAGAARPAIDSGIAMAVGPKPTAAVSWIMAVGAGIFMDGSNRVSDVASNTGGGGQHRGSMVVFVVVKIQGVAFAARMAIAGILGQDISRIGPVDCKLKGRWCGVAVGALVFVDRSRTIGKMAEGHAGRVVQNNVEP